MKDVYSVVATPADKDRGRESKMQHGDHCNTYTQIMHWIIVQIHADGIRLLQPPLG